MSDCISCPFEDAKHSLGILPMPPYAAKIVMKNAYANAQEQCHKKLPKIVGFLKSAAFSGLFQVRWTWHWACLCLYLYLARYRHPSQNQQHWVW